MKYAFTAVAIMAFSGLTAAVIPACATDCINKAVSSSTTCSLTDLACQCTAANEAAIQGAATTCVLAACGPTDALGVLSAAQADCSSVNANPAPTTSSTAVLSTPSTSSSAVAVTTTSSSAVSTIVDSSATKSTSATVSSSVAVVTSTSSVSQASTSASKASTTSYVSSSTVKSNGTAPTSAAPSKVPVGAASNLMAGAGSMAIAAGLAVLAAF